MTTTSTTKQYRAATLPREAVQKSTDVWAQGMRRLTDQIQLLPSLPQVDLAEAVERYFGLVQRIVDANHDVAVKWAEAATSLSGKAQEQADSVGSIIREQADKTEQAARAQADEIEQVEKEQARQARKLEREQAKHDHEKARERYEGLTKVELSNLLSERQLPKTGNVDELIERLVEADGK